MDFNSLYEKHKSRVFNLALNYVQNREEAEEIMQDVFVTVHRNIGKFRAESNLATWIYRITVNKSLDFIRRRNRKKSIKFISGIFGTEQDTKEMHHFDHPGVQLEQKEAMKILFAAINQLPERQRTALILAKIDLRTVQEVADIMRLNVKGVESLLMRAKANLEKKLKDSEGFESNKRQRGK